MQRACFFVLVLGAATCALAADRIPDEQWMQYADPADAGFDPTRLEAVRVTWEGMPSSAFLVVADGAVVAAWGEVSRRFMCHSVRKSFMSALYGIYWDRGDLELNTRLFPDLSAAWNHPGEAHMKLGNNNAAIRSLEKSLELEPDNRQAKQMLEQIRTRGVGRPGARRYRVTVAKLQHETCTFCPGGDTRIEDWTRVSPVLRGEELLESGDYVEGFTDRAREYGDMDLIPLASPIGVYGGSSRSWNTEETFDHFVTLMIEKLEAALPVDGVYLALHGAMAVRNVPRPEAEIARRFREVVGPDVPIAGTFDLHGNEDEQFLRWADFSFVTKRFPHYDDYIQGERAARALRLAMSGAYTPTTATRKPGVITATVLQWTGQSPAMDIMERARRWEAEHSEAYVSVFFGYPWSDVPDVGATVQVMTNADHELADRIADDMSEYIWRHRETFAGGSFPKPEEAARLVKRALERGEVPVAVGDYSDRPGDATHILKAFEAAGIGKVLYGTITDPGALEALAAAGASAGDPFDREIGGFTPSGGTPVRVKGTLVYFGEGFHYERIAAVEFGRGNLLIITPAYEQVIRPEYFRFGPVEPDDFEVFVVNSRVHFRRGFDETGYAKTILVVEAPQPFVGTRYLDALNYENVDLEDLYPYGTPPHRR
jgi:microcystin degradation protein MlrC